MKNRESGHSFEGRVGEEADFEVSTSDKEELSGLEIEVREKIREQEAGFLKRILTNEIIRNGLDEVPTAGGGKMLVETAYGKTLSGEDLNGQERVIHGVAAGASILADFNREDSIPVVGRTINWLEKAGQILNSKGIERGAKIFEAAANFLKKNPELVSLAEESIEVALNRYVEENRKFSK